MLPILPRGFLWSDLKTMDDFFKLDPINEEFFEVFNTLREEPFAVSADAVKVFNEVYYQVTRMVYEHPMPDDLSNYIADIKANMGWNYSAELVMSMAYFMISLIEKQVRPLNKFFTKAINEKFFGCLYWKPFKHRFEKLKKQKRFVKYDFRPSPPAMWFPLDMYFAWREITRNYDIGCIIKVLDLWQDSRSKRTIANSIKMSMQVVNYPFLGQYDFDNITLVLDRYIQAEEKESFMVAEPFGYFTKQDGRVEELIRENQALQGRITELEEENERQKTLLENKRRQVGKDRKFTLVQIADYCKGCVEWNDAKSIVAMLNKLLRFTAKEEDAEIIDGVENHFRARLGVGIQVKNAEIEVTSPGNYIANKINTNNG